MDEHTKSTGRTSSTPFSAALACHASFYSYPMVAAAAVCAAARGGVAYRRTMISGTILAPSASYKDVPMVMPWLTCAAAATGGLNQAEARRRMVGRYATLRPAPRKRAPKSSRARDALSLMSIPCGIVGLVRAAEGERAGWAAQQKQTLRKV